MLDVELKKKRAQKSFSVARDRGDQANIGKRESAHFPEV